MSRRCAGGLLLVSIVGGGGGGGGAASAFTSDEFARLSAREAANPELLQFTGGDAFLGFVIGVIVVLLLGLVFLEVVHGGD